MKTVHKLYAFNDIAGCVIQSRSQRTGHLVGLYHAEQADLDPSGGAWVTLCEEHGCLVNHGSQKMARSHLADPAGWCEVCGAEEDRRAGRSPRRAANPEDRAGGSSHV